MAGGSEGETETKEMVYVLVYHSVDDPFVHSLYGLEIPNKHTSPPDPPEQMRPPYLSTIDAATEPGRSEVKPILSFPGDRYPNYMGCVKFGDSQLYFMGGIVGLDDETSYYPNNVHILDLSKITLPFSSERPWEVLVDGTPMHTGKYSPLVIDFKGKIFVLSGHNVCPFTSTKLTPCEVFTPENDSGRGSWEDLPKPPFEDLRLCNHVIIDGQVVISTDEGTHWLFDPCKSEPWAPIERIGFPLYRSGFLVEDTLYSLFYNTVLALKFSGNLDKDVFQDPVELDVIKSYIFSSSQSGRLLHMDKKRFCFLQAASPLVRSEEAPFYVLDQDAMGDSPDIGHFNLTLFEADSRDNPKFLYSAHYFTRIEQCGFLATAAHIV